MRQRTKDTAPTLRWEMTRGARRAVVVLFVIMVGLAVANIFGTVSYVHRAQAAQRAQGQIVERKICTTLGSLAALKPPPGGPGNPSRDYLRALHDTLAELGTDLGCGRKS